MVSDRQSSQAPRLRSLRSDYAGFSPPVAIHIGLLYNMRIAVEGHNVVVRSGAVGLRKNLKHPILRPV